MELLVGLAPWVFVVMVVLELSVLTRLPGQGAGGKPGGAATRLGAVVAAVDVLTSLLLVQRLGPWGQLGAIGSQLLWGVVVTVGVWGVLRVVPLWRGLATLPSGDGARGQLLRAALSGGLLVVVLVFVVL